MYIATAIGACAPATAASLPNLDYAATLVRQLEIATHPPQSTPYALTGTAFFTAVAGELLTAEHVVRGCTRIDLISDTLPVTSAVIVMAEPKPDLALLRIVGTGQETMAGLDLAAAGPALGDPLTVLGYPVGSDMRRATETDVVAAGVQSSGYVLMAKGVVAAGDSGAPILDASDHVVGVLKGGAADPAEAEKLFGLRAAVLFAGTPRLVELFYRVSGLGNLPVASTAPAGHSVGSLPRSTRAAVVRVVCWRAAPPD